MRRYAIPVLSAFLLAILLSVLIGGPLQSSPAGNRRSKPDSPDAAVAFQQMVIQAKEKALAPLVFIKPIQEKLEAGKAEREQIFGSGFIIDEEGHVVTNNHVAEKAKIIRCVLHDRTEVSAEVVGLDPDTDLALIKLDLKDYKKKLPVAKLGESSKLNEGEFVMALGAPFGFSRSVSVGVISNRERYFEDAPYTLWIQTDAAINPGNSGGPLVNMKGEVVGINSLGIPAFMGDNIGFSIPIDEARVVIDALIKNKKVVRGWTGIQFQELKDFSTSTAIKSDKGVLVAGVYPESPASRAELRPGDIILKCNGKDVMGIYRQDLPAVQRFFAALPLEKPARLAILRDGKKQNVQIVPEKRAKKEGDQFECKNWEMTVQEINTQSSPFISHFRDRGVFVLGAKYDGNAQESGIESGDIIISLNGTEINSLAAFKEIYEELDKLEKGKRKALLEVLRRGYTRFLVLDFNKEPEEDEE